MDQEDIKWKQHAKQNWYKDGDRNIKFFHACASQRRKINHIASISNEVNQIFTEEEDISEAFRDYFL